jgi:hypothetical protein
MPCATETPQMYIFFDDIYHCPPGSSRGRVRSGDRAKADSSSSTSNAAKRDVSKEEKEKESASTAKASSEPPPPGEEEEAEQPTPAAAAEAKETAKARLTMATYFIETSWKIKVLGRDSPIFLQLFYLFSIFFLNRF